MRNRKHEPHKKGPAVITSSNEPVAALLPQHSHQMHHSPSFGAAPLPAGRQSTASAQPAAAGAAGDTSSSSMQHDFDVVMCGGTLGIVVALALQQQGYRVAVVEKRRVEGRTQEWNSSRHECQVGKQSTSTRLRSRHCSHRYMSALSTRVFSPVQSHYACTSGHMLGDSPAGTDVAWLLGA